MRVLVTVPNLELPGGVASYYNAIRPYIPHTVKYFMVGRRCLDDRLIKSLIRGLMDYITFYKAVRYGGYDVVHINPSLASKSVIRDGVFILIARFLSKRVVVFFHGWERSFELTLRRYFTFLFRLIYGRCDAVVVLASQFRDVLIGIGFQMPIFLETTLVENSIFESSGSGLDRSGDRDGAPLNILFLARLEKEKGLYETIDAFRLLRHKYPQLGLTIAGDGQETQSMLRYIETHEIAEGVNYCGYVSGEHKRRIFASGTLYLFPTYYGEGMPISVLEAMAYGLSVVTTAVGGLGDFFEDARMGFLVNNPNPGEIAEKVELLLANPELRRTMGRYNRQYAQDRFAASNVARRLLGIYQRVLADA